MDDVTTLRDARRLLRHLDDKHWPTARAKRPGFLVCDFDSMTWPCDTRKALSLIAAVEARAALTPELLARALSGDGVYDLLDRFVHGEGDVLREDIARAILAAPDTTEGTDDR